MANIPFITSQTLGTLRSDFTGCVGFQFTVGASAITVTDLGRWKVAGNDGTHTVSIKDAGGSTVASGSVDTTLGSAGTYVYVAITPVELTASTTYSLLTQEDANDQWCDDNTEITATESFATAGVSAFQSVCAGTINTNGGGHGPGFSYGPVNFKVQVGSHPAQYLAVLGVA